MLKLTNGFALTFSASSDRRLSDTFFSGSEFYITAKSERFALELASECEAWGARVERNGRDLVISA